MNWSSIRAVLGSLFFLEAGLLLIPFALSLAFHETAIWDAYLISIAIILAVAALLTIRRPKKISLYDRDGLITVALCWLGLSVLGALPFYFSGAIPSLIDSVFEMASGFTTTGSTILKDVEAVPESLLFWRSFSHLIGGMGVLVLALAIIPGTESDTVHLMRAEVPGPIFGKLVARLKDTARILYTIYLCMTLVLVLVLILCGMNLFDALIHAFGAAGTGGFSNYNDSVGHFHSTLIEYVLSFAMLAFGVNFNVYYAFLMSKGKKWIRSEELYWYVAIVVASTAAISLYLSPSYAGSGLPQTDNIRDAFFTVSSIITTTGYCTVDFALWPLFPRLILLFLMFVGACAGSTGGGFKVSRFAITVKSVIGGLRRTTQPHRVVPLRYEGKRLSQPEVYKVFVYFACYIFFFMVALLLVAIDQDDFQTAFSAVMTTFNNIGPGLAAVGPTGNFSIFSPLSKVILTLCMIAGRLEIYPILALLTLIRRPQKALH